MRDHLLLLAISFAASLTGTAVYRHIARRLGIVATPNERTLHTGIVPRGGGIVVVLVFMLGLTALLAAGELPPRWFLGVAVGGLVVAAVGFVDDIADLSTRARVITHLAVAVWATFWLGGNFEVELGSAHIELTWIGHGLTVLAVMWMINLFNFIDRK